MTKPRYLSVSEVAQAIGRPENYVRQHIHRKHLTVQKEGRKVYILVSDAVAWAQEWELTLNLSTPILAMPGVENSRIARITVLVLRIDEGEYQNLFTLIRHRREDTLGPWTRRSKQVWSVNELRDNLQIVSFDAPLEYCQSLIDKIIDDEILEAKESLIHYSLAPRSRCYWAYRNRFQCEEVSVISPFRKHSAEIIEYWNVSHNLQEKWQEILKKDSHGLECHLKRLGFPLNLHSERVGNLMIASAEDTLVCDIKNYNQTLRFQVTSSAVSSGNYRATIWASHCGDQILRREFQVTLRGTPIRLETDIDHYGFAIHRESDGQCVDLYTMNTVKDIRIYGNFIECPDVDLKSRGNRSGYTVNPFIHRSTINVRGDKYAPELDRKIRHKHLNNQVWKRETKLQREGDFARFGPENFEEAIQYFIRLLTVDNDQAQVIYLADPYFMYRCKKEEYWKLYLNIFEATARNNLRILCCKYSENNNQWPLTVPGILSSNAEIRSFQRYNKCNEKKPEFHDRYLITSEQETIITHSINGWQTYGVTFASRPFGVYQADSERLWNLPFGRNENDSTEVTKIL